jgi:hypothetical protein
MEKSTKIAEKGFRTISVAENVAHVQRKIAIGSLNDPFEQEADTMADRVMRMPEPGFVQRKCAHCEEEEKGKLQRKTLATFIQRKEGNGTSELNEEVSGYIHQTKGNGQSLNGNTRSFMESRFGADFSEVKIHTGAQPAKMAQSINAQAFTFGKDIYFNDGKYDPETTDGKQLLAHELTHTIQQSGAVSPKVQRLVRGALVNCPGHHTGPADRRAVALLDNALNVVDRASAARPGDPANADVVNVGNAMHTAFRLNAATDSNWTNPAPAFGLPLIRRRIEIVRDYINSVVFTINCVAAGNNHVIPGCLAGTCDPGTEAFSCHDNPRELVLCDLFWTRDLNQQARTYMHEVFHVTLRTVDDWAEPDRRNAHCYAQFVALLNGFNSSVGYRCH